MLKTYRNSKFCTRQIFIVRYEDSLKGEVRGWSKHLPCKHEGRPRLHVHGAVPNSCQWWLVLVHTDTAGMSLKGLMVNLPNRVGLSPCDRFLKN